MIGWWIFVTSNSKQSNDLLTYDIVRADINPRSRPIDLFGDWGLGIGGYPNKFFSKMTISHFRKIASVYTLALLAIFVFDLDILPIMRFLKNPK
jgi:hypothetical protein